MPRRRRATALGLVALCLLGGCEREPRAATELVASTRARCPVGDRPGYFVPGPDDGPLALLACARLGVSGKRVELSANLARIEGESHLCLNPAFAGRGRRGFYIPAVCKLHPPPQRFAVRDAGRTRQGATGYAFVVWGTAPAATSKVVARHHGGVARAALFEVDAELARRFGEEPFNLFVVELPLGLRGRASVLASPLRDRARRGDDLSRDHAGPARHHDWVSLGRTRVLGGR
jgi:hypothetical protein